MHDSKVGSRHKLATPGGGGGEDGYGGGGVCFCVGECVCMLKEVLIDMHGYQTTINLYLNLYADLWPYYDAAGISKNINAYKQIYI